MIVAKWRWSIQRCSSGPLDVLFDQRWVRRQVGELQPAGLESDHRAGPGAGFELLGEELDAAGGQPGRLDPVERRRVAALLDVAEDRLPGVEQIAALLLEQRRDEPGGVDGVGVFAADDQARAASRSGNPLRGSARRR